MQFKGAFDNFSKALHILPLSVIFYTFILILLLHLQSLTLYFGIPCDGDFKQYWATGHLLSVGQNPFDGNLVASFTQINTDAALKPLPNYSFTACTALLIYSFFSFSAARTLFLTSSVFLYCYRCLFPPAKRLLREGLNQDSLLPILRFLVFYSFYPFLLFLWDGPTTIFPFLGLFFFFWLENRAKRQAKGNHFFQGLALSLTIVKPHVCYLVSLYVIVSWLRHSDWRKVLGLAVGGVILLLPTWMLLPSLSDFFSALEKVPSPLAWRTPTFSSFVQMALHLPINFRWVFVGVAACHAVWRGVSSGIPYSLGREIRLIFVPLSLVTAPYAWTYDFVLLIFTINFIFDQLSTEHFRGRGRYFFAVAAILAANLCFLIDPVQLEHHWWYPVVIFVISVLVFVDGGSDRIQEHRDRV